MMSKDRKTFLEELKDIREEMEGWLDSLATADAPFETQDLLKELIILLSSGLSHEEEQEVRKTMKAFIQIQGWTDDSK